MDACYNPLINACHYSVQTTVPHTRDTTRSVRRPHTTLDTAS